MEIDSNMNCANSGANGVQCKLELTETPEPNDAPGPAAEPLCTVTVKQEPLEHRDGEEISIKIEPFQDEPNMSPTDYSSDNSTRDVKPCFSTALDSKACMLNSISKLKKQSDDSNASKLISTETSATKLKTTNKLKKTLKKRKLKTTDSDTSNDNERFHCDQCDHTFGSAASLYRHNRIHNTRIAYICHLCQQTFPSKAYLIKHQQNSCQYDDNLTCKFCGQQFLVENRLLSHLRKHTDERPYQCDVCSQAFKWKCALVRHMQLHATEAAGKPFACKVCGKRFTQAGLIKPHMRSHTGERPYQCPMCPQRFSHKHNMMKHQLRHDKVKQLVCEICNKKFPKESRLKYHMRVHWSDPKPFKCDHCPKSFSHRHNVTRHYKRKHPHAEYSRPDTDASFATAVWNTGVGKTMPVEFILP